MSNKSQNKNSPSDDQKTSIDKTGRRYKINSDKSISEQRSNPHHPSSGTNLADDGIKISPIFLIGAFIAALGVGYLIGPTDGPFSSPPFQVWSLIIIGSLIAIPGLVQMFLDYKKQKKAKANKK